MIERFSFYSSETVLKKRRFWKMTKEFEGVTLLKCFGKCNLIYLGEKILIENLKVFLAAMLKALLIEQVIGYDVYMTAIGFCERVEALLPRKCK